MSPPIAWRGPEELETVQRHGWLLKEFSCSEDCGSSLYSSDPPVKLRSPSQQQFVSDSPLEGDGFELLVPRHESPRFPKHPGTIAAPTV